MYGGLRWPGIFVRRSSIWTRMLVREWCPSPGQDSWHEGMCSQLFRGLHSQMWWSLENERLQDRGGDQSRYCLATIKQKRKIRLTVAGQILFFWIFKKKKILKRYSVLNFKENLFLTASISAQLHTLIIRVRVCLFNSASGIIKWIDIYEFHKWVTIKH